jgi:hypothetical protein
LFGYNQNTEIFLFSQVLQISAYLLLAGFLIWLVLDLIIAVQRANIIVSICVLSFFLYGHLYEVALANTPDFIPILPFVYFAISLGLIILPFVAKLKFLEINKNLNILLLILTLINFAQFVPQLFSGEESISDDYEALNLSIEIPEDKPAPLPDVYYLMMDGYPSNSYLQDQFGIDNSEFTRQLEERGFYVADDTRSNYTYTFASIASSLNMDFVDNLMPINVDITSFVLEEYLINSRVARIFQAIGYDYVYISNGFTSTESIIADKTIEVAQDGTQFVLEELATSGKRSFWLYLNQTTLLRFIDPSLTLFEKDESVAYWGSATRFKSNFDALDEIPATEKPTFTYFHVIKPHLPITMTELGDYFVWQSLYSNEKQFYENEEIHFEEQLRYINKRLLDSIDTILNESDTPPIIILQADHGTKLSRNRFDKSNNPIAILNAYYFPDSNYSLVYPDISPVNSFRVIFNQFFGEDYLMLDDHEAYYQPQDAFRLLFFEPIPEGRIEPPFELER